MSEQRGNLSDRKPVRLSYADQVYNYVKDSILSGDLRQGDKIVEEKIAAEFGVSRTPIREALTRLQAYGLVHIKPRSYAEVVRLGAKEASDVAHLRLRLEQFAFQLLCAHAEESILAELQTIAEAAQDALGRGDKAGYFEADELFHERAAERCGNGELAAVYRQFGSKVQLLRIAQDVTVDRLDIYMRQHFDMIEMIRAQRCTAIGELLQIHVVHDLVNQDRLV